MSNGTSPSELEGVLASRRWLRRSWPFEHIVAQHVFVADVYYQLEAAYHDALTRAGGRAYLEAHDISGTTMTEELAPSFQPLTTREWHDLLASLVGVEATGHVACGLHHHEVGSADGFPHNDLNPGWFADDPEADAIEFAQPNVVSYTTGATGAQAVQPRETVRAVAALYYLANADWRAGDGGATGLYRTQADPPRRPALIVPPLNNSLLVFECTPTSWHGFISNRRHPRNTIIMWLHRRKENAVERWGADAIIPYGEADQ
jgi:hypothetical protein